MNNYGKIAYDAYKRISKVNFVQITTSKLNILYNIVCRMKRDPEYRRELEAFVTEEGDSIETLIERYFLEYNARHGLEIRDSLTEFENPDLAEGSYFIVDTYKVVSGNLVPCDAPEFSIGDTAHIVVKHYSHAKDELLVSPVLHYVVKTDDGVEYDGKCYDTNTCEFNITLSRAGLGQFKVFSETPDGNKIIGAETALGGVLFNWREIPLSKPLADDFDEYWNRQIDRLLKVNPTDKTPDEYNGEVLYEYDMPKDNHFEINKFDKEFLDVLHDEGICNYTEDILEKFDFYELNLKAPGPCHSSNYLSIPKNQGDKKFSIQVSFDGYSATPSVPTFNENYICLKCSHHGYKLPRSLKEYYAPIRSGVCAFYGLGKKGKPNSEFKNLDDNYLLYTHLRIMQAIRFVTTREFSGFIENLHDVWDGNLLFVGGSMGGYLSISQAALASLYLKKNKTYNLVSVLADIPAFCNIYGRMENRVPCMTSYSEGMDYYDAAHFAHLVNVPVTIPRIGLGDFTCSPNGIVAMFNSLPKTIHKKVNFLQNSDHNYIPEVEVQKWFRYEID